MVPFGPSRRQRFATVELTAAERWFAMLRLVVDELGEVLRIAQLAHELEL